METTWRPQPWGCGDHVGMTGMMWGQQGQHGDDGDDMGTTGMWGQCGDHKITKNAITLEQIKIIEFYLKI